jgi:hypothetical protein
MRHKRRLDGLELPQLGDRPTILIGDEGTYIHFGDGTVVERVLLAENVMADLDLRRRVLGLTLTNAEVVGPELNGDAA